MRDAHAGLLRERREGAAAVRPAELFFDLVYVLAVTQLTHTLLDHLSLRGAVETLLLLLAVWAAWNYTTWTTNYFEPNAVPVRLALFALMLASLVMSASLPRAFGDRGLVFAAADVALTIGRTLLVLAALGRDHHLTKVFGRPLVWWSTTALLWIAGGFADGDARLAIWAVAVLIDYAGLWLGYPVPRLGRTHPRDYTIAGAHMAERCYLFITLALGESILVTGANFGELPSSPATVAAFVIAFIGSVALWWIYFDRAAEAGLRVISTAAEPGRLGLSAYTHVHIPMVAGIIAAAAADELTIAHPGDRVSATTAWVILGGPALYLIGNALFKWALWNDVPRSRLIAILALAALIPVALVSSTLGLLAAATAVVVAVAVWDTRAGRRPAGKA